MSRSDGGLMHMRLYDIKSENLDELEALVPTSDAARPGSDPRVVC